MNKEGINRWAEEQIKDVEVDYQHTAAIMLWGEEIANHMKGTDNYEIEFKPVKIRKGKVIL